MSISSGFDKVLPFAVAMFSITFAAASTLQLDNQRQIILKAFYHPGSRRFRVRDADMRPVPTQQFVSF